MTTETEGTGALLALTRDQANRIRVGMRIQQMTDERLEQLVNELHRATQARHAAEARAEHLARELAAARALLEKREPRLQGAA